MLFNVYYLNFSKVYEIKMMLSNVIKIDKTVETSQGDTLDAELQAKMGTKFLKLFSADIGSDIKSGLFLLQISAKRILRKRYLQS